MSTQGSCLACGGWQKRDVCENAFYLFSDGKIREVWSVIDKAALRLSLVKRCGYLH